MKLSSTFLRIWMDIPFHRNGFAFFSHRGRIGGGGWLTRFTHDHVRAIDMQTDFFPKL